MNTRSRAVAFVAAAAVMWGTYGSFVTAISSRGMSGNVIVFLRFLATCVPVFLYLYFTDRAKLRMLVLLSLWLLLCRLVRPRKASIFSKVASTPKVLL